MVAGGTGTNTGSEEPSGLKIVRQPTGSKSKLGGNVTSMSSNNATSNNKMGKVGTAGNQAADTKFPLIDKAAADHQGHDGVISEQDPSIILADQQRDVVYTFCHEFAEENGFVVRAAGAAGGGAGGGMGAG